MLQSVACSSALKALQLRMALGAVSSAVHRTARPCNICITQEGAAAMLTLDDLFLLGRLARARGRLAVLVGRCARSAAQQQLALPGLPKDENVPCLQPQRVSA